MVYYVIFLCLNRFSGLALYIFVTALTQPLIRMSLTQICERSPTKDVVLLRN